MAYSRRHAVKMKRWPLKNSLVIRLIVVCVWLRLWFRLRDTRVLSNASVDHFYMSRTELRAQAAVYLQTLELYLYTQDGFSIYEPRRSSGAGHSPCLQLRGSISSA